MSRTFLVTGAASGIGARLAQKLLARGERVCAADINLEAMAALRAQAATPANLLIEKLDVREPAQWAALMTKLIAAWGTLDVAMNVAGVLRVGYVHEQTPDDVHFQLDINTKGLIFGTQAAAKAMLPQGRGHIINVCSLAGIAPVPGIALYSASKFAARGYSLATALELRPRGIHVTAVCPDAVQTPMLDIQKDKPQAALTFSGPRALTVDEVADAILGPVLNKAPLELTLPASRGWLSKLASMFPQAALRLNESLRQKGLQQQRAISEQAGKK